MDSIILKYIGVWEYGKQLIWKNQVPLDHIQGEEPVFFPLSIYTCFLNLHSLICRLKIIILPIFELLGKIKELI